jgi:3-dehydroquinate dehydratase-1
MPVPAPPLLIGVVDSAAGLERAAALAPAARPIDLVEARVDLFDAAEQPVARWRDACARLEAAGVPVLVTIRSAAEGGKWTAPDGARLALYRQALAVASWVDAEAASPIAAEVAAAARAAGATAVLSHHDFARTPPLAELLRVVDGARAGGAPGPVVAKVATTVTNEADRAALLALLAERPERTCVIGMGPAASDLRVTLPARGSQLAYGYLDRPTAPGQLSAAQMDELLRAASPAYAAHRK